MMTIGLHGVADPAGLGRTHDHGVAVMRDGEVLFVGELERLTRKKHDGNLERHVERLLEPWLARGEKMRFVLANSFLGAGLHSSQGSLVIEGESELEVPAVFAKCQGELRGGEAEFYSVCHEAAHLGTCLPFFGAFEPDSLLVHIDGGASRSCASAWRYDGQKLACLDHGWHSGLKSAVNNFNDSALSRSILELGPDDHLSMPGKLMGLAALAAPDLSAMEWLRSVDWLREGPNGDDELRRALRGELRGLGVRQMSSRDRGCQIIAACMQRHLEEEVLRYIRRHQSATGAQRLYYSGGAALNVHCNARIESELGFDAVMIPPAPNDTGLALGAAALLEWSRGEVIRCRDPFLNSMQSGAADKRGRPAVPVLRSTSEATRAIANGAVIGVWMGDAEFGPRALGHRSILVRPDSVGLRRRVSESMKRREWYRPVAPMMLEPVAVEALHGYRSGSNLARFMLGAWKVRPQYEDSLEGCIHADGSVRAQVIADRDSGVDHVRALLELLREDHDIVGVINTSFNSRGVPIVHELGEAFGEAEKFGLDALWLPEAPG